MGRPKLEHSMATQISTRLDPDDYMSFKKLCYMEFSPMSVIARRLILDWVEKNKKKLK